jgi:hypothetical protein
MSYSFSKTRLGLLQVDDDDKVVPDAQKLITLVKKKQSAIATLIKINYNSKLIQNNYRSDRQKLSHWKRNLMLIHEYASKSKSNAK